MESISTSGLFIMLGVLLLMSGFFSSSETALMTLNRYRLRHLADSGNMGARLAQKLLERPDRLLGLILLGNNFVNILASVIATIIAQRLLGNTETALTIATGLLTFTVLIFAEVAPKTLAALYPEPIAFPAAYVYTPLLKLLYPFVLAINLIANAILKLVGVHPERIQHEGVSVEELRSVVMETSQLVPQKHQDMLLGILNLENASVDDIMVPRNEITALDLDESWEEIIEDLTTCQRTRLPVYRGDINNIIGIMHMRRVITLLTRNELTPESLESQIRDAYFIPEGTSLYQQLINFQNNRRRTALIVDEYGDIQGLVTLEDILEEVVGEFTTASPVNNNNIIDQGDGSFLIMGNTHLREINRSLNLELPTSGPKTLNGLILEHLESIPTPGTTILVAEHPIEVTKIQNNAVQMARLMPRRGSHKTTPESFQPDTSDSDRDSNG